MVESLDCLTIFSSTQEKIQTVGFVGVGAMGDPMSAQIAANGFRTLIHDADPTRAEQLAVADADRGRGGADGGSEQSAAAGGRVVADLDAIAGADAVVLMLPNSDIVEAVLLDEGLLERMAPGSVLIDMSSSDARRTVALGPKVAAREIDFADAPVSGGVAKAGAGELTAIVGAEEDLLAHIEPLLKAMAANVFRVGSLGSGHAAKALNNLLSATGLLISIEAVEAGKRFGIDPETLLELLNVSTGMNHATQTKIDRYVLSGRFDSGFRAELMLKDLRLARAIVEDAGLGTELADAVVEQWATANEQLPAGADQTEIHHVTAGKEPVAQEAL
jgi:3-hydroxyisobutyrate dehydrogenase